MTWTFSCSLRFKRGIEGSFTGRQPKSGPTTIDPVVSDNSASVQRLNQTTQKSMSEMNTLAIDPASIDRLMVVGSSFCWVFVREPVPNRTSESITAPRRILDITSPSNLVDPQLRTGDSIQDSDCISLLHGSSEPLSHSSSIPLLFWEGFSSALASTSVRAESGHTMTWIEMG